MNKAGGGLGYGHRERMCQGVAGMKISSHHAEAELKLNSGNSKISAGDPRRDSVCFPKATAAVKIPKSAPYLDAGPGHIR